MATSPQQFFRFLAENTDLVMVLSDRAEIDEAELMALIERHRGSNSPTTEHLRGQLEALGIIERTAHADASFAVSTPVADILAWLTKRQRLSSAVVLQAYLTDIVQSERELSEAVRTGDPSVAAVALKELQGFVDRVRFLSAGNREAVVSEAQRLRSATEAVSSVERFALVVRLWDRHLTPLRHLVRVDGEMEQILDRLRATLDAGEERFFAHGPVHRAFARSLAHLARMRRSAFEDHHAAIQEIEPLYRRMRRDSRWLRGASRALARIRVEGVRPMNFDERMGLVRWRNRNLMSDEKIRARMAALVGYTPPSPVPLAAALPPPKLTIITRDELAVALRSAVPVDDVLAFVLDRWPDHLLVAQLRAFGELTSGTLGPLQAHRPAVSRCYSAGDVEIEAVPLSLPHVRVSGKVLS